MWARGIVGIVFCLTGLVWIGQGTNVISNSKLMSGHGQYTLLGIGRSGHRSGTDRVGRSHPQGPHR